MGLRYVTKKLTASAESAGTSSVHALVAGWRGLTVQIVQSGSVTGMSATVRLMGTNCASGFVTSGYSAVRLGSIAITSNLDQQSGFLISSLGPTTAGDTSFYFPFKYAKFTIETISQGTPIMILGGYVDDDHINDAQSSDISTAT